MTTLPPRITLRRVKGWRMPEGAVKVDRTSIFGNPWAPGNPSRWHMPKEGRGWQTDLVMEGQPMTDTQAALLFVGWLGADVIPPLPGQLTPKGVAAMVSAMQARRRLILSRLPDLRGRPLACWCKPGCACHADVLIHMANEVQA